MKYVCTYSEPTKTVYTDEYIDRLSKLIEAILVAAAKASTPPDTYKMINHGRNRTASAKKTKTLKKVAEFQIRKG